jgi:subtilisin family serine protease
MSAINTHYFSPQQLRTIRDAVNGNSEAATIRTANLSSSDIFKTAAAALDDSQDVLILAPEQSLFKSEAPPDLSEALAQEGVEVKDDLEDLGAATARLSKDGIARLKEAGYQVFDNSPRPLWNGLPRVTTTARAPGDYSMPQVNPTGWLKSDLVNQAGLTGEGQTVAVLDSGFDHPAFPLKAWVDVVNGSQQPVDKVGHGTHVAHDILKTAPDADIVAVKVMADDGSGRPSDIMKGIAWVAQQKLSGKLDVDIINMSLGGAPDGFPDSQNPINRAVELATRAGITVVAAAGNSGPDGGTIGAPAESEHAIAVGAALNPTKVSDFSSRGPTEDGLIKPDVIAPGEFIAGWSVAGSEMEQTARAVETLRKLPADQLKQLLEKNPQLREGLGLPDEVMELPADELEAVIKPSLPPTYIPAPGLVAAPGTSFAAPLVAGVLATLEQARDITPEQSMALLRGTASEVPGYKTSEQGAGFVDAKRALDNLATA